MLEDFVGRSFAKQSGITVGEYMIWIQPRDRGGVLVHECIAVIRLYSYRQFHRNPSTNAVFNPCSLDQIRPELHMSILFHSGRVPARALGYCVGMS